MLDIAGIVEAQRKFFESGKTRSYDFRLEQLKKLRDGIRRYESDFSAALKADLGKPEFEAYMSEIGYVLYDISDTIKCLKKWMRPKKVATPMIVQPGKSHVHYCPLGVNLIISPFNYPLGMTFGPLIAAIAAGNTAVLKTSELTPESSKMMQKLVEEIFAPEFVAYVPGAVDETTQLLKQKFDHIMFTGSINVGRIVMKAAAEHLTPVTLELGGKSPCIVFKDAKIDLAVRRIVFGKFLNMGQTCVAPDYLLVHEDIKAEFVEKLKERIAEVYGSDPINSPALGRIVNQHHYDRIMGLIDQDKVVCGGTGDRDAKFIAPTVMDNVTVLDKIMDEEIFGPVLPVLEYSSLDDVYRIVKKLPQHPLACYIYCQDPVVQREIIDNIQYGGGCINHCIQHLANPNLPFGGVGLSGIGRYHGFEGFRCFSHLKSVFKSATWIDMPMIYPPFKSKLKLLKKMLK